MKHFSAVIVRTNRNRLVELKNSVVGIMGWFILVIILASENVIFLKVFSQCRTLISVLIYYPFLQ